MIAATFLNIAIVNTLQNSMPLVVEFSERTTPVLKYNGGDERHQYMMPSELTFTMEVSDASDLFFKHLFTGNESNYKVDLLDQDDVILWRGFLLPEQYNEPYEHALLYVTFTATDGLARLKEKFLPTTFYDGTHSVITVLHRCLQLTNLAQEIYFAPSFKNDAGSINTDWNKIFIDLRTYKKTDKPDSCYKIIESLLETLGCSLVTYKGIWYITGHNRTLTSDNSTIVLQYYRYAVDGTPAGFVDVPLVPEFVNFEASPEITLLPPLQRVTATWDIDERENPLPDDAIQQPYTLLFPFTNPPATRHWQSIGTGINVGREILGQRRVPISYGLYGNAIGNGGLTADEIQRRLNIISAPEFIALKYFNRIITANENFYMQLLVPVYLKSEPDFIDVDIEIVAMIQYGSNTGQFPVLYDAGKYGNQNINYEILIDGVPMLSNRLNYENRDGYLLEFSPEGDDNLAGDNPRRVSGVLSLKDLQLPLAGGLLQVRLYAVADPLNELGVYAVGFRKLDIRYSARDTIVTDVTRDIDWTTVQELDVTHGGSVGDMTYKGFTLNATDTETANYTIQPIIGVFPLSSGFVIPYVSTQYVEVTVTVYAALQAAVAAGDTLYGKKFNETVYTQFKTVFAPSFMMFRTVGIGAGTRYFVYLEYVDGTLFRSFIIFAQLQQDTLYTYTLVVAPQVPRAFRERWSRIGAPQQFENRTYSEVRAQMVHDTTPQVLVKIDASIFGLWSPLELMRYKLDGFKNFIPVNLSLALDQGMTTVTMIELEYDNEVATSFNA